MIFDRYFNFLSSNQLARANHEMETVPRWIYRDTYPVDGCRPSTHPNNFWRYYIINDLEQYDEQRLSTWYGHQKPPVLDRLSGIWREMFDQILTLAGPNFLLQRYTITGQTQGQDGHRHTDVTAAASGTYRSYLCYLNKAWDQSWGGTTEIVDPHADVHHEYPEPGKLIVFDSKALHRGLAPVLPNVLRITMLWHGQYL